MAKPSAAAEPDPLLTGLPVGAEFVEGRGPLGSGKWGVRIPGDNGMVANLNPTKEAAAKEAREWLGRRKIDQDRMAVDAVRDQEIATRLRAGGELTDADLKHLGLKTGGRSSGFEWLSPAVQRLFGISKAKVRAAMGDALHETRSDMGAVYWVANPRTALANAARFGQPAPVILTEVAPQQEPDHLAQGRKALERAKARKHPGYADEVTIKIWEPRLAADPAKWKPGMGVSYEVASGGRHKQINRGFRIVEVDPLHKMAVLRQVRDTGLTTSGGDHDRIGDEPMYLGDLRRDRKYDDEQRFAPEVRARQGGESNGWEALMTNKDGSFLVAKGKQSQSIQLTADGQFVAARDGDNRKTVRADPDAVKAAQRDLEDSKPKARFIITSTGEQS